MNHRNQRNAFICGIEGVERSGGTTRWHPILVERRTVTGIQCWWFLEVGYAVRWSKKL